MDLKTNLQLPSWLSGKKRVDKWVLIVLGLFGLALVLGAAWLALADWRMQHETAVKQAAAEAAVEQLVEPVQSIKRVLGTEQVQSLAARAVENPATGDDLFAYVNGRMSQINAVRVFPRDLSGIQPEDLGPNGFALFEMLLSALDGNQSLLQIHHVMEPPVMVDAVPIRVGDEVLGVLVATMSPDGVVDAFQPDFSALGAARLTQSNGAQPASKLREVGDLGALGDVPERVIVPGTLFRVEYPRVQTVGLVETSWLLLMLLIGLACLAVAVLLWRSGKRWALEQQIEDARHKRESLVADEEDAQVLAPPRPVEARVAQPAPAPAPGSERRPRQTAEVPPPLSLKYNIPEKRKLKEAEHQPVELTREIFRAYDIRGVIDKTLDSGVARSVGQAIGTLALEADAGPVVVARDGRLSGPYLMQGMIEGILSTGCDVLDIGAVPTGVLYFAAHEIAAGSGVMITGSHNPPDYNGFKIMVAGDTLYGDGIADLYNRISEDRLQSGEGQLTRRNVVPDYIERIASDIQIERPLKVVIDCGNGIGGVCAADTLRAIGAEVLPLFDEVDGSFPNHHPDPSEPENLKDLIESVRLMDADLGLALDGDADRLGVVTLAGNIIFPDRVMMLLAMDVLDRVPGATIIYDVKCTGHLPTVIREAGGVPMMYKTGHSLIKAKMKEIGSPFAGEMSGHFFFGERWYGVDDGIYSAARLLEILGSTDTPPEAILNALPSSYSTPELKVQMQEGENHRFIEAFRSAARFEGAEVSTIDGLRADFADGWGLVRASNTTPILVVRFDAETEQALERIKGVFRSQMLELKSDLELPF
jgi:phosphomannomutase/phosphoglucomutase